MKGFKRAIRGLLQSFSRRSNRWLDLRLCVERVTGIEPAWPAWKAGALPLSYTREVLGQRTGPARRGREGAWASARRPPRPCSSVGVDGKRQGDEIAVREPELGP